MFSDPVFANAFVADGVVPDSYGMRTIVEYRARLYAVPCNSSSQSASEDRMDIITPSTQTPPMHRHPDGRPKSLPQAPDPQEGEQALRNLTQQLDLSAMGPLNPSLYAVLRVFPPHYARHSALAATRQHHATDNQNTPTSPALALLNTLRNALPGTAAPGRDTELSLLSWHWADDLLAIATGTELDRLCAYHFGNAKWEMMGDRHRHFYAIRCLAFRPFAGRVLALGSRRGLALLHGQNVDILSPSSHTDILSLDWSPDGQLIASASAADGLVLLTDVATRISKVVSPGSFVCFCPARDTQTLFIADAAAVNFRIWDCRTWTCERWGSLSGPVVAATWSSDGSTLLFSTDGQGCIHVLSVGTDRAGAGAGGGPAGKNSDSTIAHVEMTTLPREGPGGTPVLLELDPTGERLAVAYEVPEEDVTAPDNTAAFSGADPHRRFAVALYATQLRPCFAITPIGYVSGSAGSGPAVALKFKPRPVGAAGAMLSCMWRSGEVTFTHLFFNASGSRT